MNEVKLEEYQVVGNIHTVELRVNDIVTEPREQNPNHKYLSCLSHVKSNTGEIISKCRINVSNYGDGEILSYSEFKRVTDEITNLAGIEKYSFSRIDFKFDSQDGKDFEPYLKINKLITLLFTEVFTIKSKNKVETANLITGDIHSIWVMNNDVEIQFYDKTNQTEGERECARYELRRKRLSDYDPSMLCSYWSKKFDKLPGYFEKLQRNVNDELIEVYRRDKDKLPCKFKNHNDFALLHQTVIFTHSQLVDLFERMGIENANTAARNFKQRYRIEYFSSKDIESFLVKYKEGLEAYFNN